MLPSKSCKTINANFLLKNFGLTFFDRFKTGTYLVNWFGRGSGEKTWRFGGSAEPCRTSKFGRYRCRCRFIGRSLITSLGKLEDATFFRIFNHCDEREGLMTRRYKLLIRIILYFSSSIASVLCVDKDFCWSRWILIPLGGSLTKLQQDFMSSESR